MPDRPPVDREAVIAGLRQLGPRSLRLSPGQARTIRGAIEVRARRLRRRRRWVVVGLVLLGVVLGVAGSVCVLLLT